MRSVLAALAVLFALAAAACGDADKPRATAPRHDESEVECPRRPEPRGGRVVTIFHETHTHGNLAGAHEREHDVTFAEYAGLVNALRACLPNPDDSLFVGNGDDVSRALDGYRTDGRHTVEAFNAAGLAADTFGFSEVLFGEHYDSFEDGLNLLRDLVADRDHGASQSEVYDRSIAAAAGRGAGASARDRSGAGHA
jgi:2',3'-cyclic-nucleotide 2'-phosphodiesterase (5'-nucleotidase family)